MVGEHKNRIILPQKIWFASVITVSLLPLSLHLLGVNFGVGGIKAEDIHVILEWVGFSVAILTVILSLFHFTESREISIPIIGLALGFSGVMDAFHALASHGLIVTPSDVKNFVPFTWAISRFFNAIILGAGCLFSLSRKAREPKLGVFVLSSLTLLFSAIAFGIIYFCSQLQELPRTYYPDSLISRPWDIGPLIIFILGGIFAFPRFYRKYPSYLSLSLLISLIPQIATQLHMIMGSQVLFDSHFNMAHFLKIVAYFIPFSGLCFDDMFRMRELRRISAALKKSSEQKFSAIAGNSSDAVITANREGCITYWNRGAENIFLYRSDEAVGKPLTIIIPERFRQDHLKAIDRLKAGGAQKLIGKTLELAGLRKNGEEFPVDVSLSFWESEEGDISYTGIIRDISERKKLEKMKDEFVAAVSHEIRTPLSTVKMSMSNLLEGLLGRLSSEQLHAMEIASRNVNRLGKIADDILDISRLESGKIKIKCVGVDVKRFISDAVQNFEDLARARKILLREDIPDLLPALYVDSDRIGQVLNNLLGNALRYARREIVVKAATVGPNIRFSVIDDGTGIDVEDINVIFGKFVQIERPQGGAGYKGTGLGLSICKNIVELHGGKIWAESAPGAGMKVHFTLPIEGAKKEVVVEGQKLSEQPEKRFFLDREKRVLLIDDEEEFVEMLTLKLTENDFLVEAAYDGESGLKKARSFRPDVILLDILMPQKDGWDVCRDLRSHPETKNIPVIFITALMLDDVEKKIKEVGASLIISKPFDEDNFVTFLKNFLSSEQKARKKVI